MTPRCTDTKLLLAFLMVPFSKHIGHISNTSYKYLDEIGSNRTTPIRPKSISIQITMEVLNSLDDSQELFSGNTMVPFCANQSLAEISQHFLFSILNLR